MRKDHENRHDEDDDTFEIAKVLKSKQLDRIEKMLKRLSNHFQLGHAHITGGKFVIVVKDTNPDVAYDISGVVAEDAEGNVIPDAQLTYEVVSDNPSVVEITPNDPPTTGNTHFGAPGQANVNVNVKNANGDLLGALGAQFTVTVGDPSQIAGGTIKFGDLVDQ